MIEVWIDGLSLVIGAAAGVLISFAVSLLFRVDTEIDAKEKAVRELEYAKTKLDACQFRETLEEMVNVRMASEKEQWQRERDMEQSQFNAKCQCDCGCGTVDPQEITSVEFHVKKQSKAKKTSVYRKE